MNSFYTHNELIKIGFKKIGNNIQLSRKSSIYNPSSISLGNNVRIDDFCILSGKITIGSYVHIAAYSCLYGNKGITISDFCGISPRSTLLSASDDFSGNYMISPMVPNNLTHVTGGPIILNKYCQIGTNSVIFPNVILNEGSVIGACSLVLHDVEPWSINIGIPSKKIKERMKNIIYLSKKIYTEDNNL